MTTTTSTGAPPAAGLPPTSVSRARPSSRALGWARLRGPASSLAIAVAALGAIGQALGTVVAGSIAEDPTGLLVGLLALCLAGGALLDTVGRTVWAAVVDRAEGRLRADLVTASLHQPLQVLSEQAVGEFLDRIDDDTHEVGSLLRQSAWDALRTALVTLPLYVIAGLTWWPAWIVFPLVAVATFALVRPMLGEVARRKVIEEMAWTDHAAVMEEGVAGRDDLRTSLGQPFLLRRTAELAARVHARFDEVLALETTMTRRTGLLLHALLAGIAISGVALASSGRLSVAQLVTLFLVTSTFVGQIDQLARHLPDLQAGLGAVVRLRQLLDSPEEPVGGEPLPPGGLDLELRALHFAYPEGDFALTGVDLHVAAGRTCALVGRSGSGKSTLVSLLSRAIDPPVGSVLLGGVDITRVDLQQLRGAVGVVTQRTEILAGTLAENVALFGDVGRERVEAALAELGLSAWVAGLPAGIDTPLGPGGTTLSAGEEQLVAFARLLVRDVRVVVLDEATARMDPRTEAQVVRAAERLLSGRTGVLVAHRLSTIERADDVVVLEAGRAVQQGARTELARQDGPLRRLLEASAAPTRREPPAVGDDASGTDGETAVGGVRRQGVVPELVDPGDGPRLARTVVRVLCIHPWWGLFSVLLFLLGVLGGAFGVVTGLVWGRLVQGLQDGTLSESTTMVLGVAVVISLMSTPLLLASAIRRYPRWWVAVMLRVRAAVLVGQTSQHRLVRTPAGEAVARAMDADRLARYADRWVDLVNGLVIVVLTVLLSGSLLAGGVLLAVMAVSALASAFGSPAAGRSAAAASTSRAHFGRSLVSALESARTVKLAAATPSVHAHLLRVDSGRVEAAIKEHRIAAVLAGVPVVMVQCGVVAAWAVLLLGGWGLATALLVAGAVSGFDWFGRVAGAVITEAPGVRAWGRATSRLAGGRDLMELPDGLDLVGGTAAPPASITAPPALRELTLHDLAAVHDDGTVGVSGVDLRVGPGELVLLLGQVGSGKSSLLAALAGLVEHTGDLRWNGETVLDPQRFLRPRTVAYVAQVPRVLSGTFRDNVVLDHDRGLHPAVDDARLGRDLEEAGGPGAVVGHRGVRLSGGQVQRLALARALASGSELLLADDVSSALDATTEVELWEALRERGTAVLGSTSKWAALARADRVVVLVDGRVAETGAWSELAERWGHLAG